MTGVEIATFIIGVVIPSIFKVVGFIIDKFFPNTQADDITNAMEPFIAAADTLQKSDVETHIEGAITEIEEIAG